MVIDVTYCMCMMNNYCYAGRYGIFVLEPKTKMRFHAFHVH